MNGKMVDPNRQNESNLQTGFHQDNSTHIIFSGQHNTQSPVINQNTTVYNNQSITTWAPALPQISPARKLVYSIVEVIVKTIISTVLTMLMHGDIENLSIPEFKNLDVNTILLVLWFGIYGIASLLVLIFRLRQKRGCSTLMIAFVLFFGLAYLQTELSKNGYQNYVKIINIIITIFVFSLIIADVVIVIKRIIEVIKSKKWEKGSKTVQNYEKIGPSKPMQ